MFKGNNKAELNEATLIAALQEYFDRRIRPGHSPRVLGLRPAPSGATRGNLGPLWEVDLGESPIEADDKIFSQTEDKLNPEGKPNP